MIVLILILVSCFSNGIVLVESLVFFPDDCTAFLALTKLRRNELSIFNVYTVYRH
jgi:hypothetical protein